ncbi:MAG: hypothetical protein GY719_38100 [bacterium]|nr:hypothetical protein [bacterium]
MSLRRTDGRWRGFTKNKRITIFRRQSNGFDRCVLHVGRRLYIDLEALRQWLAKHRGSRF